MKKIILAGAAAASLLAVPALAVQQAPVRQAAQPMTRAAIQARVQAQFARADANRDGFITQTEAQAVAGQRQANRGERRAERGERRAQRFAALDTNRDGSISRAEFEARTANRGDRAERQAKRAERRAGRLERRGDRQALRGARGLRLGQQAFVRVDADKDGRISLAEATASRLARFDRLDVNRDGTLTREERRAGRAQRQGRRNG